MQTILPQHACCPKCGIEYEWRPEHIGRLARCSCGHVIRVPDTPGEVNASGAAFRGTPPNPPAVPESSSQSKPHDWLAGPAQRPGRPQSPGIDAIVNRRMPNEPPPASDELDPSIEADLAAGDAFREMHPLEPSEFKDRQLPVALLAAGGLLLLGQVAYEVNHSGAAILGACIGIGIATFINVALMLVGVLIAAKLAGINFGRADIAVLKLCSLYIGPSALGAIISQVAGGDLPGSILGSGVSVLCYWGLLAYLFRLDAVQTLVCVATIWAVKFIATLCIVGALVGFVTSHFGLLGV